MAVANNSEVNLISAILNTGDIRSVLGQNVTTPYFRLWPQEFDWLVTRYRQTHKLPGRGDFINKFPSFPHQDDVEDVELYVQEVIDAHSRDTLVRHLGEATTVLQGDNTLSLDGAADILARGLREALAVRSGVSGLDMVHGARDIYQELKDRQAKMAQVGHLGWYTGLPTIDTCAMGLKPGWYVVFGGRPKTGKTWWLLKAALNMARQGADVGIFSTEMSRTSVYLRLISMLRYELTAGASTWNTSLLTNGMGFTLPSLETFLKQLNQEIKGSLQIFDQRRSRFTPAIVETVCDRSNINVAVVDYLGQFSPSGGVGRNDGVWQTTKSISNEFQSFAQSEDVLVLAGNQINRAGASNTPGTLPDLSKLAGGDSIGQDADLIVVMDRLSLRIRYAAIIAFRHGDEGLPFFIALDGAQGRWEEVGHAEAQAMVDTDRQQALMAHGGKQPLYPTQAQPQPPLIGP